MEANLALRRSCDITKTLTKKEGQQKEITSAQSADRNPSTTRVSNVPFERNGLSQNGYEGWGPAGWGPQCGAPKGGEPKISRFFSFSHFHFHSFFSLWGSSRGILVVFWSVGTSNVLVFAFRSCGSPRRPEREKKTREDRQREKKRMKMEVGEGKKRAKFWAVRRRRSGGGARGPWEHANFGPTHTADTHSRHTEQTHTTTHTHPHKHTPNHTLMSFFLSRLSFFFVSNVRFFLSWCVFFVPLP